MGAMLLLLLSTSAAAVAGTRPAVPSKTPLPEAIKSASLTQAGKDLVWAVRLGKPFSPASLERLHVSLCLLIERATNGALAADVCVQPGPNDRSPPHLVVTWGTHGRRVLSATITQTSAEDLEASVLPASVGVGYAALRWQVEVAALPPACTSPRGTPNRCIAVAPAIPALLALHTPRLVGCAATGPTQVFHGSTKVRSIALTFDDGPWGDPPSIQFVDELARLHVPGTFFEIGEQISEYDPHGAVERAMLANGDMIGDHTWTHPDMVNLSAAAQRSQIAMTAAAIRRATGFQPCLFRAPYGAVDPELLALVRSLGMTTIQWDIDPRDWALPGVSEIERTTFAEATNGGIVELHFGGGPRYETLEALPDIVATLRAKGYTFVTLTQMLGYRLIYK